jgi:hypothetical protein
MSHDGAKFYVLTNAEQEDRPITVVLNWFGQERR